MQPNTQGTNLLKANPNKPNRHRDCRASVEARRKSLFVFQFFHKNQEGGGPSQNERLPQKKLAPSGLDDCLDGLQWVFNVLIMDQYDQNGTKTKHKQ